MTSWHRSIRSDSRCKAASAEKFAPDRPCHTSAAGGQVAIGAILIHRREVRPFSEKQIKLLETFADQAVIAIENVRLFQELEARTRELAQSVCFGCSIAPRGSDSGCLDGLAQGDG